MTCDIPEHAALEKRHTQRGTAFFQLRGRLQRANIANPIDSEAAVLTAEEIEEMEVGDAQEDPGLGPRVPDLQNTTRVDAHLDHKARTLRNIECGVGGNILVTESLRFRSVLFD
jgi:hypothetical protein